MFHRSHLFTFLYVLFLNICTGVSCFVYVFNRCFTCYLFFTRLYFFPFLDCLHLCLVVHIVVTCFTVCTVYTPPCLFSTVVSFVACLQAFRFLFVLPFYMSFLHLYMFNFVSPFFVVCLFYMFYICVPSSPSLFCVPFHL